MQLLRKSEERGYARYDWLETYHSFSFAGYYDARFMNFRSLRVINQDRVAPGKGFPMHAHRDMEIITLVLAGCVEHRDSMGHTRRIKAGEAQCMTAGTGVQHSEMNPLQFETLELLQIWIEPAELNLKPAYREAQINEQRNALVQVAGPLGSQAPLIINQDAELHYGWLEAGQTLQEPVPEGRHLWVQVVSGTLQVNGVGMSPGDGMGLSREDVLVLSALQEARFIVFKLA